ncbi:hypothetical protein DIPPA_07054 [Diplonema papillatum]|nr:hypothetical protein DIPPA_07054 [Diplonema papillatum]
MHPVIPNMETFDPFATAESRAKMAEDCQAYTPGSIEAFRFPVDEDFWEDFVACVEATPGAQDAPAFGVAASHRAGDPPLVANQRFVAGYVRGWERSNPHKVMLLPDDADSSATFHASHSFWRFLQSRLPAAAGAGGPRGQRRLMVRSTLDPRPPIELPADLWREICAKWEDRHHITKAGKQARRAALRGKRGRPLQQQQPTGLPTGSCRGGEVTRAALPAAAAAAALPTAVVSDGGKRATFALGGKLSASKPPGAAQLDAPRSDDFWAYGVLHYHVDSPPTG